MYLKQTTDGEGKWRVRQKDESAIFCGCHERSVRYTYVPFLVLSFPGGG